MRRIPQTAEIKGPQPRHSSAGDAVHFIEARLVGRPRTHDLPASASLSQRLQACATDCLVSVMLVLMLVVSMAAVCQVTVSKEGRRNWIS